MEMARETCFLFLHSKTGQIKYSYFIFGAFYFIYLSLHVSRILSPLQDKIFRLIYRYTVKVNKTFQFNFQVKLATQN